MFGATQFNFTAQLGAGVQVFTSRHHSIDFGYKYRHISNANLGRINPGTDRTCCSWECRSSRKGRQLRVSQLSRDDGVDSVDVILRHLRPHPSPIGRRLPDLPTVTRH
jgi:Lipid A 3-O-deacylase (PagL)